MESSRFPKTWSFRKGVFPRYGEARVVLLGLGEGDSADFADAEPASRLGEAQAPRQENLARRAVLDEDRDGRRLAGDVEVVELQRGGALEGRGPQAPRATEPRVHDGHVEADDARADTVDGPRRERGLARLGVEVGHPAPAGPGLLDAATDAAAVRLDEGDEALRGRRRVKAREVAPRHVVAVPRDDEADEVLDGHAPQQAVDLVGLDAHHDTQRRGHGRDLHAAVDLARLVVQRREALARDRDVDEVDAPLPPPDAHDVPGRALRLEARRGLPQRPPVALERPQRAVPSVVAPLRRHADGDDLVLADVEGDEVVQQVEQGHARRVAPPQRRHEEPPDRREAKARRRCDRAARLVRQHDDDLRVGVRHGLPDVQRAAPPQQLVPGHAPRALALELDFDVVVRRDRLPARVAPQLLDARLRRHGLRLAPRDVAELLAATAAVPDLHVKGRKATPAARSAGAVAELAPRRHP